MPGGYPIAGIDVTDPAARHGGIAGGGRSGNVIIEFPEYVEGVD
jgi:hypothetical protein